MQNVPNILENSLPRDLAEQGKEALKYLSELRQKGHEDDAEEFESFLSNMVKKQATKQALLKLKQTISQFTFDMRFQIPEISELLEDIRGEIRPEREVKRNPFCMHKGKAVGKCDFCFPPEETAVEISQVQNSLREALEEKREDYRNRKSRLDSWMTAVVWCVGRRGG